ncbi:MAG: cell envelope integrity protein CreD, partial [Spirochaetales bacterium]
SYNIVLKMVFIVGLILIFLIPLLMIRSMVNERRNRNFQAEEEITALWGGSQVLAGPYIAVPYRFTFKEDRETKEGLSYIILLPEKLSVTGDMTTELRSRGIYSVPVYETGLALSGHFTRPDLRQLRVPEKDIFWDQALFVLELPDMRALQAEANLVWSGEPLKLRNDVSRARIFLSGIQTELPAGWNLREKTAWSVNLKLRGAKSLSFLPLGATTEISLTSTWASPSFSGSFLPRDREVGEKGFSASWYVVSLARNYPDMWKAGDVDTGTILASEFGVELFKPVDLYTKVERSVKYGILFVFLPFLTFFLFEIFSKNRIHIFQYLMIGAANIVFYLLLLSLSEQIGFNPAYIIGAAATTGLIVFYSSAVLATKRQGYVMAPVLIGLYVFLYAALQSEDYALLIGSIGLFALVAAVMVITRKVQWYNLNRQGMQASGGEPPVQPPAARD